MSALHDLRSVTLYWQFMAITVTIVTVIGPFLLVAKGEGMQVIEEE